MLIPDNTDAVLTLMEKFNEQSRAADNLYEAAKGVIAAFDAGVFVRNTSGDNEPGWAIKALPHLAALGRLVQAVEAKEKDKQ